MNIRHVPFAAEVEVEAAELGDGSIHLLLVSGEAGAMLRIRREHVGQFVDELLAALRPFLPQPVASQGEA